MASGKNHDRSILFASPLVLVIGCYQFGELGIVVGASHLLGGLYLSPDLDLVSRPYKRWGVLRWVWIPYQRLVPHHRHWSSHAPVLGSLFRLTYLGAWLLPLWLALPALHQVHWSIGWSKALAFLVGVELSALNHLLLDGLLVPLPLGVKKALKGD